MSLVVNKETKKWTAEQYLLMSEAGVFGPDERVELIEGEIVPMAAQNGPHIDGIINCNELFVKAFTPQYRVACQTDLQLSGWSIPVPDFCMFKRGSKVGGKRPNWGELVVEVADSSLAFDRHEKASMYAKNKIPEYWVLSVKDRCVYVYRDPVENGAKPYGFGYDSVTREEASVSPLCRPDLEFAVADMLLPA